MTKRKVKYSCSNCSNIISKEKFLTAKVCGECEITEPKPLPDLEECPVCHQMKLDIDWCFNCGRLVL